jgi:hypothetical protein
MARRKSKYGLGKFLLDILLIICTGGLWLFFKLFQYMHRRRTA